MIEMCRQQNLPEPEFYADPPIFRVTFTKLLYSEERLRKMGLNERQIKAILWIQEEGNITNTEYQEVCNVSKRTATRDLSDLVNRGILKQLGRTGKQIPYLLERIR